VIAVRSGTLSRGEAYDRYMLSEEVLNGRKPSTGRASPVFRLRAVLTAAPEAEPTRSRQQPRCGRRKGRRALLVSRHPSPSWSAPNIIGGQLGALEGAVEPTHLCARELAEAAEPCLRKTPLRRAPLGGGPARRDPERGSVAAGVTGSHQSPSEGPRKLLVWKRQFWACVSPARACSGQGRQP
jgi:hypothetical protein